MSDVTEFPILVNALYTGMAGTSGSFTDNQTGELIQYAEALGFDFTTPEGVQSRLTMRANKFVEVAEGIDPAKLVMYRDAVTIEGVAVIAAKGRSFFRPTKITKATTPAS